MVKINAIIDIPDAIVGENTISDLNMLVPKNSILYILGNDAYTDIKPINTAISHIVSLSVDITNLKIGDTAKINQKIIYQKIISIKGIQISAITKNDIIKIVKSLTPTNYFSGKILSITGDSEAAGHSIGKQNTYGNLIASRNNMTINNYAVNGRKLITGTANSLVDTYTEIAKNSDYILVQTGYTDSFDASIADDSKDKSTFKGAFNTLVEGLQNTYPTAKIGFIEPYYFAGTNLKPRAAWIKERCEFYHIQCIDGTAKSGLRKDCEAQSDYFLDAVHLTALGHKRMSYIYENFLKGL